MGLLSTSCPFLFSVLSWKKSHAYSFYSVLYILLHSLRFGFMLITSHLPTPDFLESIVWRKCSVFLGPGSSTYQEGMYEALQETVYIWRPPCCKKHCTVFVFMMNPNFSLNKTAKTTALQWSRLFVLVFCFSPKKNWCFSWKSR